MITSKHISSKIISGLLFIVIVAVGLVVAVIQTNSKSQSDLRARAADPCEAYTKSTTILENQAGIVVSKEVDRFVWNKDGNETMSKIVVICAGARITKQAGGALTYDEIYVGDNVFITGQYGDTTQTTILAAYVRDGSVSKVPMLKAKAESAKNKAAELKAKKQSGTTPTPTGGSVSPSKPICISEGSGQSCNTICANTYRHGCAGVGYTNCPCCGIDPGNTCEAGPPTISCYCNP